MVTVLKLLLTAVLLALLSLAVQALSGKAAFKKLPRATKQALIGVAFGLLAICGTELGVSVGGAVVNCRDAAPLCAALLFGAPAGIIAGVIGGAERWFAVLWGAGEYTQLACTLSTIMAGAIGALLRRFMFDDKRPSCFYGLVIGMVMEMLHMLMIFLTHMSDVHTAFFYVRLCAMPMIALNGFAVMLATLLVSHVGRHEKRARHELRRISQTFQRYLLVCVLSGFFVATLFSWVLQTELSENDATALIALNIKDVQQDILDASDKNLLAITRSAAREVERMGHVNSAGLKALRQKYDVAEINVIDARGVITASTFDEFLNYNMNGGTQSAAFLTLLNGKKELVQSYQPTSAHGELSRKYAGVALSSGGFVQVAYDAERFQRDIDDQVIGAARNRHVGEEGCILIADEKLCIVSDRNQDEGQALSVTGIALDTAAVKPGERFLADYLGVPCYCMYAVSEGYYILGVMPQSEVVLSRDVSVTVTVLMEFLIFGVLFVLVYFLIKKLIVENINRVNHSLAEITHGNLDVVVNVRANEEFASLSDDINATVVTLKQYIAEAAARIDQELEFARSIQHSALPCVFPPFPERKEFSIYADMFTAKEVGGDFYDFYFVDEDHLAFTIADVSGKGIPAAMFMMTSKTLLKGYAETRLPVNEVFGRANEKLCANNETGMFLTAWLGILNTRTGDVTFANAGHNPPLLKRADGQFEFLHTKAGFILAGMEGIRYCENTLRLMPGDELFLYTDGVTEAIDTSEALYGNDRLLAILNARQDADVKSVCEAVKADLDHFVGAAAQFDDITMLCLRYEGGGAK